MRRTLLAGAALILGACTLSDPRIQATPTYVNRPTVEDWDLTALSATLPQAVRFLRTSRARIEEQHRFYLHVASGSRGVAAAGAGGAALNAAFAGGAGWTTGLLAVAGSALAADLLTANGDTRTAYAAATRGLDCVEATALEAQRPLPSTNPGVLAADQAIGALNGAIEHPNTQRLVAPRSAAAAVKNVLEKARERAVTQAVIPDDELGPLVAQNTTRIIRDMNSRIEGILPDIRQAIAIAGGIPGMATGRGVTTLPANSPAQASASQARTQAGGGDAGERTPGSTNPNDPAVSLNEKTDRAVTAAGELDRRMTERRTALRDAMAACGVNAIPPPPPLTLLEDYTQDVRAGSNLTLNVQGGSGFYMIQQTGEIVAAITAQPYVGPGPFRLSIPTNRPNIHGGTFTYSITDLRNPALPALPLTIRVAK